MAGKWINYTSRYSLPWIRLKVGNGENSYIWYTNWPPSDNIIEFLRLEGATSLVIPQSSTLEELWSINHWILPPARSECKVTIQTYISTLALTNNHDTYKWWPNNKKVKMYNTRDIYLLLRRLGPHVIWHREIWFSNGIMRQEFLAWLLVLNHCPTRDWLLRWGLPADASCLLCNYSPESQSHLFFGFLV